ncbi:hypothetical protein CRM90_03295 [Mycobacterium sp. ENV421]|uniref:hypothetical protein n=1 Tax=Mycobacterium sp. ENV421 TaxID=1213407 RepID=UPI000C9BF1DB|nr:hypothetical protein [Mycobacterium sp. ENV421]PND59182.1 hypothetical protein CRM90_03295 [Mycobacterium sp. ENV421]
MSLELRCFATLLIGVGTSIVLAPLAVADPPSIPEPGSESAAATIRDLDAAGYDVQLQYENGAPLSPLSQCTVTDINTTGSAGSQGLAYITINCPK